MDIICSDYPFSHTNSYSVIFLHTYSVPNWLLYHGTLIGCRVFTLSDWLRTTRAMARERAVITTNNEPGVRKISFNNISNYL
jgi:hypothetical protein